MIKAFRNALRSAAAAAICAVMVFTGAPAGGLAVMCAPNGLDSAVVLFVGSPFALVDNKQRPIAEDDTSVMPVIENGRVLVPLRFISESLAASVDWHAVAQTAVINFKNITIRAEQGKNELTVNGVKYPTDAAIRNIGGRIFAPLRALAEAMGKHAFYDRGLIVISDDSAVFDPVKDRQEIDLLISRLNGLPVLGSKENLIKIAGPASMYDARMYDYGYDSAMALAGEGDVLFDAEVPGSQAPQAQAANDAGADYSTTNVQVAGVDEGDIIKTDGQYIYYLKNNELAVVKAAPADSMKFAGRFSFGDGSFNATEMYVDGNLIVVLGNSYDSIYTRRAFDEVAVDRAWGRSTAKAFIFDSSDKENIVPIRELETEGNLVSSRKIGDALYFVSSQTLYSYVWDGDYVLPACRDTATGDGFEQIGYDRIYYFPNCEAKSYTMVTGVNLKDRDSRANVYTYLGSGESIYVSQSGMYVTEFDYMDQQNTEVYKFSLTAGKITYVAKGSVPGSVLNQFSMDEYRGHFRIATTTFGGRSGRHNNLYVLNGAMATVGRIENIAPGERIYSVRFMGDKGYMVTFETVDPLFVIDLKDPADPKILGALKIPGYSDYLHPYDENHLIGFGKDTYEEKGTAYYMGMKLSLFDVSDVANPIELHQVVIGGRGTDSPVLSNHRALLYDGARGLMAFPVAIHSVEDGGRTYGVFEYQGALVYSISVRDGFREAGRISHLTGDDYLKSGMHYADSDMYIERLVTIGDTIYSASNNMILAHDLNGFAEKGRVSIK